MFDKSPSEIDAILLSITGVDSLKKLERRRAEWCVIVAKLKPAISSAHIGSIADMIIGEAQRMCRMSPLDPDKIVPFYLGVSLRWLLDGKVASPDDIVKRFPTTVDGIGMMIIAEGINPHTGARLTKEDIERANKGGKIKIQ